MANSLVQHWAAPRPAGRLGAIAASAPALDRAGERAQGAAATLDADQMRDCGLDPVEVRREAIKPFWRE